MADELPVHNPEAQIGADSEAEVSVTSLDDIAQILAGYKTEAEAARKGGPSPRDDIWRTNWDRYWGRYDHSKKADWQSRHVMPEAPQFVDRWAAAMREALDSAGEWYTIVDGGGQSDELAPHIKKVMDIILGRCAHTPDGHRVGFSSVFEDQMKLGALMTCAASVTWKDDANGGYVSVDSVDPREIWLDPKMRNLYRLRQYEIDFYELKALADKSDSAGQPLYNIEEIAQLVAAHTVELAEQERSAGHGKDTSAPRKQIVIDEWLAIIVDSNGRAVTDGPQLIVVANSKTVIRGPEPNPFWHGSDWLVTTPMVPVPFSVYGRSYMEDWADVADAFVEMTNLILDGVFTSTLKAFAALPDMLKDPKQLEGGMSPNIIFLLSEEAGVGGLKDFIKEIDLGTLPSESIQVWTMLKQELRDGAKLSEIALGQIPPTKRGITATEINKVSQSGSAMIRSMARTIETRLIEVILTLVWQCALQHMDFMLLVREIGEDSARMLTARREEFRDLKITFKVRGISGLIDRQTELNNLISMLTLISQNDVLLQAFLQKVDVGKLINRMFTLFGVDPATVQLSAKERQIQELIGTQQQQQPASAQ